MTIPPVCSLKHPINFMIKTEKKVNCYDCNNQLFNEISYVCEKCPYYLCFNCTKKRFGVKVSGEDDNNNNNNISEASYIVTTKHGPSNKPTMQSYIQPLDNTFDTNEKNSGQKYENNYTKKNSIETNTKKSVSCYIHDFILSTSDKIYNCTLCNTIIAIRVQYYPCNICKDVYCLNCYNKKFSNDDSEQKIYNKPNTMSGSYAGIPYDDNKSYTKSEIINYNKQNLNENSYSDNKVTVSNYVIPIDNNQVKKEDLNTVTVSNNYINSLIDNSNINKTSNTSGSYIESHNQVYKLENTTNSNQNIDTSYNFGHKEQPKTNNSYLNMVNHTTNTNTNFNSNLKTNIEETSYNYGGNVGVRPTMTNSSINSINNNNNNNLDNNNLDSGYSFNSSKMNISDNSLSFSSNNGNQNNMNMGLSYGNIGNQDNLNTGLTFGNVGANHNNLNSGISYGNVGANQNLLHPNISLSSGNNLSNPIKTNSNVNVKVNINVKLNDNTPITCELCNQEVTIYPNHALKAICNYCKKLPSNKHYYCSSCKINSCENCYKQRLPSRVRSSTMNMSRGIILYLF